MNIKTKLISGLGSILVALIVVLWTAWHGMSNLRNALDIIALDQYSKTELIHGIQDDTNNMAKSLRNIALSPSGDVNKQGQSELSESRAHAEDTIAQLKKKVSDGQMTVLINELQGALGNYLTFQNDVLSRRQAGNMTEASRLLTEDSHNYQQALFDVLKNLSDVNHLQTMSDAADATSVYRSSITQLAVVAFLILAVELFAVGWITRNISLRLSKVSTVMDEFAKGSADASRLEMGSHDEIGVVAEAFNHMAESIRAKTEQEREFLKHNQEQAWLHEQRANVLTAVQLTSDLKAMSQAIVSEVSPLLGASCAVLYVVEDEGDLPMLSYMSGYAVHEGPSLRSKYKLEPGEGLAGQCALQHRIIEWRDIPEDYLRISSALGDTRPRCIMAIPLLDNGITMAVLELAFLTEMTAIQHRMAEQLSYLLGLHISRLAGRIRIERLLAQSQALTQELQEHTEELQLQQEGLAQSNAELEEQATALRESEQQLQQQQEELEQTYEEAREKTALLEEQNERYKQAQTDLIRNAQQLEAASTYKSEFLANMSHELRTPLNSMLILTKLLKENKDGNLSDKQVGYAATVHASGTDLLALINEILDLAKVESRTIELQRDWVRLADVAQYLQQSFEPIAQQRQLSFDIRLQQQLPAAVYTDSQRLRQILQNLLSNAFKFTERGGVTLTVELLPGGQGALARGAINPERDCLAFTVTDTGIGIPQDKLAVIFEAFVQADGTTNRMYGGTGLGLSISRELARLLGGEIRLRSAAGEGSSFTLVVPLEAADDDGDNELDETEPPASAAISAPAPDARPIDSTAAVAQAEAAAAREPDDELMGKTLLLVDDDGRNIFALTAMLELHGVNVVYAENGRESIEVLKTHPNIDLVLMDVMMPEMDGYEAMRIIRSMPRFEALPIIAVTAKAMRDDRAKCLEAGASDYITKPVDVDKLLALIKVWLYAS